MKSKEEQRAEIRFCVWSGWSPTETFDHLRGIHGPQTLCKSSVFHWHARFRSRDQDLKDKNHNPGPRKLTPETLQKLSDKVNEDRRKTVRQLAHEMELSHGSVHTGLWKKLGVRKKSAAWIPHLLTAAEKLRRVTRARAALHMLRQRNNPVHIISGDESWFYCYQPENKQSSAQWMAPGDNRLTKACIECSGKKLMLILFFDCYGVVHREFIPNGHGVNTELYLQVLKNLRTSVRRKRPVVWRQNSWCLLHDNAPAHIARPVREFLEEKNIDLVPHPGYSLDLSPLDYWIFSKLKRMMASVRHRNLEDLRAAIDSAIKEIPQEDFRAAMDRYPVWLRKCIQNRGNYFEHKK